MDHIYQRVLNESNPIKRQYESFNIIDQSKERLKAITKSLAKKYQTNVKYVLDFLDTDLLLSEPIEEFTNQNGELILPSGLELELRTAELYSCMKLGKNKRIRELIRDNHNHLRNNLSRNSLLLRIRANLEKQPFSRGV